MADRIVPEAGVRPSASPVDRFVAPVMQQAPASNGLLDTAAALQNLNPALQRFLQRTNEDNAATAEAQGSLAEQGINSGFEFRENRDNWREMISRTRRDNPELADQMTGANPHFRRGVMKARMNRLGMGLNDHLMNLWRENPEIDGVPLHDIDDTTVVTQWLQNASAEYSQRFGVENLDPLMVNDVYGQRVNAAQDQLMSRHTEFRLNRYNQDYLEEMSANTGLILAGGGNGASDVDSFLNALGQSENSGRWGGNNGEGYYGLFQFGQKRLTDFNQANGMDVKLQDLDDTPGGRALQDKLARWHIADIDAEIARQGFLDKGYSLDGLRAVAHLGGKTGMVDFVLSGGSYDPDDSNGTNLSEYYAKFSGPVSELQTQLNSAIGDGMDPRRANETIVASVVRTAMESGNPAVLASLNDISTGNGMLGDIGWVKDQVTQAEDRILADNWQNEQRAYTLQQRQDEQRAVEFETKAIRSLLDDPYGVNLRQLEADALAIGQPDLAKELGALQETLINRDQKVWPDHELVTDLRVSISQGNVEPAEFYDTVRQGISAGRLNSAQAMQLLDDFDSRDRFTDTFSDRQVQGVVSDFGKVIAERFSFSDPIDGRIPGTEKGIEAEQYMRRNIVDFIAENPEATTAEVRDYSDHQLERLLKSPIWQPTNNEVPQSGVQQRPFGAITELASDIGRLETEPATVLADWLQSPMTPVQLNMINVIAASRGMTAQEFIAQYGGQPQGN